MRALVVRMSSIGDVVHTLPVAAALSKGGIGVTWLVEPASLPLLRNNPVVERCVAAPAAHTFRVRTALEALGKLRSPSAEVALDLQGLWKSAVWARLSGPRRIVGFDRPWRREPGSALLLSETVALPVEAVHVIDKNLALLRPLGLDALGCRSFPLPEARDVALSVDRRLADAGLSGYVVLNAGGGWTSKLWPAESFGRVGLALRRRGLTPLVSWGPGEEALADRVVAASQGTAVKCFPTALLDLVEVLRRAVLVVAADTGPLHLACAVGTPVVGIYGPTDPSRNGPFDAQDIVVRRTPPCAPCHRRVCAVHEGVMQTITEEEVLSAIDARLRAGRGGASLAV